MKALISLTDKSNVEYLSKSLSELGIKIISTGGTLKVIRDFGVNAIDIESITNFPEMLGGRVKTLSPYVHGGILYRRGLKEDEDTIKEYKISPIDIVVVNLYDFQGALKTEIHESIVENIDIGGPTLIRAAAKNYKDVLIVTDPSDYEELIERLKNNKVDIEFRERLAAKAYSLTAYYDSMISRYFLEKTGADLKYRSFGFEKISSLRYGENPSQKAAIYRDNYVNSYLSNAEVIHGKEMSFNNYNDLNAAVELSAELGINTVVALKHSTPCAAAKGKNILEAYSKAYNADPVSIFGGIVSVNGVIDRETAVEMSKTFLEIIAATDFTKEALEILTSKKNVRLVKIDYNLKQQDIDLKYLDGVVLIQDRDTAEDGYEIVTKSKPTDMEKEDLIFAMKVVKYTKSNAIVVVKDGATLGIGGGQTSRVWALESIRNNHPDKDFSGSVLASDAFFPFDDCVRIAGEIGVCSIIQPGGSLKDKESIDRCDELNISMVFTGNRHFKH
ncbi:bifunctional phosphoribosylaminoimidazolecarboxamide formyltransferase/IMP cyclohydrolase [Peptoniphilus sp. oral taxon 386]|uniref:bifunctional phosphoribosylaminoimidazolecarboxamide formyltransferase/IMP cyclohydrolase n=1 Tax=Peptoniphilus sp. oral taxon 386 TaxID=652713 RepID=UPI0001DA9A1F|nr:bifunctional phosphoribosylaminoimidazolecarboxamide formyltransferase/IMP cyclohydrolase [Peptoniphilus sp. oral taxon 386]EFI41849.1 phosphoribosylaminoimidazolecarboxamide formyltransferase/IMP cyclohydrolase [Peptoniphilus sp. oral taxon 386 str. F0131]